MSAIKKEQAEVFVDQRRRLNRLTRDDWTKNGKSMIDLSYWFCIDKSRYRIHEIGEDLTEIVERCIACEEKILTEHKNKKDEPAKKK